MWESLEWDRHLKIMLDKQGKQLLKNYYKLFKNILFFTCFSIDIVGILCMKNYFTSFLKSHLYH